MLKLSTDIGIDVFQFRQKNSKSRTVNILSIFGISARLTKDKLSNFGKKWKLEYGQYFVDYTGQQKNFILMLHTVFQLFLADFGAVISKCYWFSVASSYLY